MQSLYEILEISTSASESVIRAAYRCLAQKYHPDKLNSEPSVNAKKMVEINFAYSVLSDNKKRNEYDFKNGINNASQDRRQRDTHIPINNDSNRNGELKIRPFGFRPFS